MALNGITINKGQGGLGRPLEGTDYISSLLFYSTGSLPTGFDSSNRTKIVYSVEQAESLGITNTHLGETAAVAKIVIGGTPAIGDSLKVTYTGILGLDTVLATYALLSGEETSPTTAATAFAAKINANTINSGFSATASTGTLLITTKGGEGVFPNAGAPYVATVTGASMTATVTQPTGTGSTVLGVASTTDVKHYHISEFFRLQPKGKLYVSIQATADVGTFAKVTEVQNFAQGEIKQMGVYYTSTAFATSACNALQSVCTALAGNSKPISSIILAAEISATADVTTISTNLHGLSCPNVSVTIAQDGANVGHKLFHATGKSITNLGEMLGAVALSKVSESIAWFGKFQVASAELDTLAFANGQSYLSLSDAAITNLDSYGFCFLRKVIDLNGSFHNRPYTSVSLTNDYAFIYSNRTIDKAIKNLRQTILPSVASPIKVNADGTLSVDVINFFKSLGQQALDTMLRNAELSNYQIIIDPSQDVLSTNTLELTAELQPLGVADFITINVGFTLALSN